MALAAPETSAQLGQDVKTLGLGLFGIRAPCTA